MKRIFDANKFPSNDLQTDMDRKFFNEFFQDIMTNRKINHFSSYSNVKASIVERLIRTLKNKLWEQFSLEGNYKWVENLQNALSNFKNSVHGTISMKPIRINKKMKNSYFETYTLYSNEPIRNLPSFR